LKINNKINIQKKKIFYVAVLSKVKKISLYKGKKNQSIQAVEMKILVTTILVLNCWGALASILPEDEVSWEKRIDKNIDKNRKSDVILKIKVDPGILYTYVSFVLKLSRQI
jgi:hypothetical protein